QGYIPYAQQAWSCINSFILQVFTIYSGFHWKTQSLESCFSDKPSASCGSELLDDSFWSDSYSSYAYLNFRTSNIFYLVFPKEIEVSGS
ncbi:hypothetical protein KA005_10305, partial [bacterium]|nr:hypothetical protein [bacterium]